MSALWASPALLLVPVVTGFASVLWSPIAAASWTAMALLNAIASGFVWAVLACARPEDPTLAEVARTVGWPLVVGYMVASIAVALLWFCAHESTGVVWIAFAETGWGVAALLFTVALCRIPMSAIRPLAVTPLHGAGAVLIVAGAIVLAAAERGEATIPGGVP